MIGGAAIGLAVVGLAIATTRERGGRCSELRDRIDDIESQFSADPAQDWDDIYTLGSAAAERDALLREQLALDC